jgi:hypothetical protein
LPSWKFKLPRGSGNIHRRFPGGAGLPVPGDVAAFLTVPVDVDVDDGDVGMCEKTGE